MVDKWACKQGYGCWPQHKDMMNVIYTNCDLIGKVSCGLALGEGEAVGSFGLSESMGYLVNGGFVMERRIWSEKDFYPQLELFSKSREGLSKLAKKLNLPFLLRG